MRFVFLRSFIFKLCIKYATPCIFLSNFAHILLLESNFVHFKLYFLLVFLIRDVKDYDIVPQVWALMLAHCDSIHFPTPHHSIFSWRLLPTHNQKYCALKKAVKLLKALLLNRSIALHLKGKRWKGYHLIKYISYILKHHLIKYEIMAKLFLWCNTTDDEQLLKP